MKPKKDKGGGHKPKRKKAKKPPPTLKQRARSAVDELRKLSEAVAARHGLTLEDLEADELVLPVKIPLQRRGSAASAAAARDLATAMSQRFGELVQAASTFLQGHVYCFQCDRSDCKHSVPSEALEVFAGYSAIGKPPWKSFPSLCLEVGDPRVDRLFGDSRQVIALVQTGDQLTGELLPGFGRGDNAYQVLGQTVAGLLPASLTYAGFRGDRLAVSLQVLELRRGPNRHRLRLNVVGIAPEQIAHVAAEPNTGHPAGRLRRALAITRRRLETLGRQATLAERRGQPMNLALDVEPVLSRLKVEVERMFRPHAHRTQHAQDRHKDGDRPISSAIRDAREVPDDRVLHDVRRDTLVVLGRKGRAHLFSPDGRHVTSLQLRPGELERKSNTRWRPATPEQAARLRKQLSQAQKKEGARRTDRKAAGPSPKPSRRNEGGREQTKAKRTHPKKGGTKKLSPDR